jgi:hypothetical protein
MSCFGFFSASTTRTVMVVTLVVIVTRKRELVGIFAGLFKSHRSGHIPARLYKNQED